MRWNRLAERGQIDWIHPAHQKKNGQERTSFLLDPACDWIQQLRCSGVAELGHRTVVQATVMGMALGPGDLLVVHLAAFAAVRFGVALGNHRLMTVLIELPGPHPGHKAGFLLALQLKLLLAL